MAYQNNYKPYGRKVNSGAAVGLEKKQAFISKSIDRKEKSMKEFAALRDAAMFAVISAIDPEQRGATRERLEEEHVYWRAHFEEIYNVNGNVNGATGEKAAEQLLEEVAPHITQIKVEPQENLLT